VGGQLRAELLERRRGGRWCSGQRGSAMADHRVVAECTQDPRIVWISIAGVGREQQLLLEPEVPAPMAGPVGEERLARFGRGRIGRAAKLLGDHQRLVVVTRQRGEGR
jgi:hypothetical protein